MILYTDVPLEPILAGMDKEREDFLEMEWNGIKLLIEPVGENQGKIVRMLSTDPQYYLKGSLMPGTIIHYVPQFSEEI